MIEHYENPEDAIPYETTILVLSETDDFFGDPAEKAFDEVRSGVSCEKHLVEEHYLTLDELPEYDRLIQYDVWVIHHSCLLVDRTDPLLSYLRSESFPDETQVLLVVGSEDDGLTTYVRGEIETEYSENITVVSSRTAMVYYLLGHLQTATPCSAAGLDYLVSRNNKISDNVGPHRDAD